MGCKCSNTVVKGTVQAKDHKSTADDIKSNKDSTVSKKETTDIKEETNVMVSVLHEFLDDIYSRALENVAKKTKLTEKRI
ncbi:unnamed protein product [Blepharisma stoltei]|uniref:Uncharacterized protein n=1 Tax=Blepharisma stoltei TaxID=1481888 RepID=A0AAU9K943_9CILI|nr:unnamed protein product [Blepharisma stoltei]